MSVRERCSCGAEFESDDSQSVKLLREWRRNHVCVNPETAPADGGSTMSTLETTADSRFPEMHIGFRPDPFDE